MVNEKFYALGTNRLYIRELAEYGMARAAQIGRENVFDFSIGNPSVPAPAAVNEAIVDIVSMRPAAAVHSYTPAGGGADARRAVAADLNERFDCGARPENLFFTCGAAPAVATALAALGVAEGECVIVAPFFPEYTVYAEAAGMKSVIVPPVTSDFQLHASAVEPWLTPRTQAVLINSPNNPSGVVYSAERIRALGELLERKGKEYGHPIYLVADEPYRELVYDGLSVPFVPLLVRNSIVCYSYSKSLSLPGERLGYLYIPDAMEDSESVYAAVAGAARAAGHVCAPSLMQHMIARCASVRPDLEVYDRNRRLLYEALCSYGYECVPPQGAFYLLIRSPRGSAREFSDRAKARDVLIVPCDDFGCPGYLRLGTCVSTDTIKRALPIFRELIEEK